MKRAIAGRSAPPIASPIASTSYCAQSPSPRRRHASSSSSRRPPVVAPLPGTSTAGYAPLNAQILRINQGIERAADAGNLAKALRMARHLRDKLQESAAAAGNGNGNGKAASRADLTTYTALAKGFANHGLYEEALRLLDDARAVGVEPDVNLWNQVLKAHLLGRQPCEPVLQSMEEEAVGRNALTLHLLIQNHVQCGNLEAALDLLLAKDDTGASPASSAPPSLASSASITYTSISPPTFQYHGAGRSAASLTGSGTLASVVRLAATQGETALAADLIQAFEDQGRRLPEDVFSLLISASIAENDASSALIGLRRFQDLGVDLDEGVLVLLANLFSRHGMVDETQDIVLVRLPRAMDSSPLREWHYAPLIAAYTAANRVEAAILTFQRSLASIPAAARLALRVSYKPFVEGLQAADGRSVYDAIIQMLEERARPENEAQRQDPADDIPVTVVPLPIQLVNALLEVGIKGNPVTPSGHEPIPVQSRQDDVARILSFILDPSAAIQGSRSLPRPDIDTFNLAFSSCMPMLATRSTSESPPGPEEAEAADVRIAKAEAYLDKLRNQHGHLTPNKRTYTLLVQLYLSLPVGDSNWQLAFDYLEEMKHFDIMPPASVYIGILTRLLAEQAARSSAIDAEGVFGDATTEDARVDLVLQEMAALGYLGRMGKDSSGRNVLRRDLRTQIGSERITRIVDGLYRRRKIAGQEAVAMGQAESEDPGMSEWLQATSSLARASGDAASDHRSVP